MKHLSRRADPIGYCQRCNEPLTHLDVLGTGQAKECRRCHESTLRGRVMVQDSFRRPETL